MKLYAADLDNNGTFDPILFNYIKDASGKRKLYPAVKRHKLLEQVSACHGTFFPTHQDYASATFDDIFEHINQRELLEYKVDEMKSSYFINKGNGQFVKHALSVCSG